MSILILIAGTLLLIGAGSRAPRLAPQPVRARTPRRR